MTSSEPRAVSEPRPTLLVIGDSLSYYGPKGGLPADDPRIWPNLVADSLGWDVELIARIGWTTRDAWWAMTQDPRVWAAIPRAGAVVLAVGGMDTLPSPLPTALREGLRYVRPPALRRVARNAYGWLQPRLAPLGRPVALPPRVSVEYLETIRDSVAYMRPDLPLIASLPSVHRSEQYRSVHAGRIPAVRAVSRWATEKSVPLVDLGEAVREDIASDAANPDGIHWGWEGHRRVAEAMLDTVRMARRDARPAVDDIR
ncbi:diglucosylglycerate octanoyltransferase [Rhodococcus yananensis]|uniref:diglucosylglycerate octanoyltransferase n=1 Tax=Rhodococcus yananensis TaxID=2879464 RepID=UPI001CF916F1|nr:diglucosylglycerate octanoyltransferase [Rhodococcus yananensis]